jgi:hypothetical protein
MLWVETDMIHEIQQDVKLNNRLLLLARLDGR